MGQTKFTVGRDKGADIPIADDSVSRLHAELTLVDGGTLFVTDCRSSNGTFLVRNGASRQIQQDTFLPTDQVKFGSVTLSVADILAVIHSKGPRQEQQQQAPQPHQRQAYEQNPPAEYLIRCYCGAVKPAQGPCPSCHQ